MDSLQLFAFLRQYNADIVVIGGLVAAACFFIGKLCGGKVSDKLLVFLPFALGAVLYFAYGALFVGGVAENAGIFIKHGFSCGSFATAAKVVAAQLFTKGNLPDRQALRTACVKRCSRPIRNFRTKRRLRSPRLPKRTKRAQKRASLPCAKGRKRRRNCSLRR